MAPIKKGFTFDFAKFISKFYYTISRSIQKGKFLVEIRSFFIPSIEQLTKTLDFSSAKRHQMIEDTFICYSPNKGTIDTKVNSLNYIYD